MGHYVSTMLLERVGYGHPDAVRLIEEVQQEYVVRYGSPDESPIDPLLFDPPGGSFYVGYVDGEPVATGAWRRSSVRVLGRPAGSESAEIKRMYVVPAARGAGLARMMLSHLEASALQAGLSVTVLETGTAQPEAIGLYTSAGYVAVSGFGHYRGSPLSRCFARDLSSPGGSSVPSSA